MDKQFTIEHSWDIVKFFVNLSHDEVFTPTALANQILDRLPESIWKDSTVTFLDPFCKTGVFPREITRRLIEGLKEEIPDRQERINHILTKQMYGIGITELTSLMSRRSVYCSKVANGKYSICTAFDEEDGNIHYEQTKHNWVKGKCSECLISKKSFDRGDELESHAYEFIHKDLEEVFGKVKFDVIIGNPPYQLNTAGTNNGAQAKPIYHKFVEQAKRLNPKYLCMVMPSRWFTGGWGLDEFRTEMINDTRIREIHDYPDAREWFPTVEIKGGVCYFLWESKYNGRCNFYTHESHEIISERKRYLKEPNCDILIRYNEAVPIFRKVSEPGEASFSSIVSTKKPFGFGTNFEMPSKPFKDSIKVYAYRRTGQVSIDEVTRNKSIVHMHKVIVPKAVGSGESKTDVIKPIYCEPGACSTETYLLIGPFPSKEISENVMSYIGTKFFHFLVTLQKNTQDCMKRVYTFVPMQDFSEPWTDEKLYKKYGLTQNEINFIESTIWPGDTLSELQENPDVIEDGESDE